MSIAEDLQLEDIYTRYEDTRALIVYKQAHVSNPLDDDGNNDDNDVDHEQIELRPTVAVESESAGDLHACKTQTSSADLEPTKSTDSNREKHIDTHENTTAMRSWDSDTEDDVEGEKIELIQKP